MMSLTKKQAELLAFIERYQNDNAGVSPSFHEMRDALGLASKSGVHRLINALEERGRLIRRPFHARAIEIVRDDWLASIPTAVLLAELASRSAVRVDENKLRWEHNSRRAVA